MRVLCRSRFRDSVCWAKPQPPPKELLQLNPHHLGTSQIRTRATISLGLLLMYSQVNTIRVCGWTICLPLTFQPTQPPYQQASGEELSWPSPRIQGMKWIDFPGTTAKQLRTLARTPPHVTKAASGDGACIDLEDSGRFIPGIWRTKIRAVLGNVFFFSYSLTVCKQICDGKSTGKIAFGIAKQCGLSVNSFELGFFIKYC